MVILIITSSYYFFVGTQGKTAFTSIFSSIAQKSINNNEEQSDRNKPEIVIENLVSSYTLPKGTQVYSVSHGDSVKGPRMSQVTYSPLSIDLGDKQIIKISFPNDQVVSSGVLFITTDNLENQKVTLKKSDQADNSWSAEWVSNDTASRRYNVRIYIVGPNGTYDNTMTFL